MATEAGTPKRRQTPKKKKRKRYTWHYRPWMGMLLAGILVLVVAVLVRSCTMQQEPVLQEGVPVQVYHVREGQLRTMDSEEYLVGVVAAEMPADFDIEALKAQAVAARTYMYMHMEHPNAAVTALHPQAQLTTSPETSQAWISEETQKERWGSEYDKLHRKVVRAVAETCGETLRYDGSYVEPLFHASCGGGDTEDAAEVWGNARPYLVSVTCNHPTDPYMQEKTIMSLQEMQNRLGVSGTPELVASTASNRVKEVRIGGTSISGMRLRDALGLKSTLISWTIDGNNITFITNGFGHGVGMCQYGAGYYAQKGQSYRQILERYYPGAKLTKE